MTFVAAGFSQGHSYEHYDQSAMYYDSDSAQLDFSFYTQEKKKFGDEFMIYAIRGTDTTKLKTDFSGRWTFHLAPAEYDFIICSDLMDSFTMNDVSVQRYRLYYFDFYFQLKTFRVPEIRFDLGKPVIYCYNDNVHEEISIRVNCTGEVKFIYPDDENGWQFKADSVGQLQVGDRQYPYLFWDAVYDEVPDYFSTGHGFTVEQNELVPFFDSLLTAMNFNACERTDFIVYWVPQMKVYDAVDIYFLANEKCDELATLDVKPFPDELFRLYMIWKPSDGEELIPQNLPFVSRKKFTIIEWGGMKRRDRSGDVDG